MNLYDVLKKPLVTEKAEALRAENVYIFEVDRKANKKLIKEAVRKIYGVTPEKVNVTYINAKRKRNRYGYGFTPRRKKAYVFLDKKDKIEIFEGV